MRDGVDRKRDRSAAGTEQDVDLVLFDQLARVARAGRGIGSVVKLNRLDLDAIDFVFIGDACGDALGIRDADRCARSG